MNDWLPIFKMAVPFLLLFAVAEWLYHKLKLPAEFTRKLVHVVTGLLTFLFPSVFDYLWQVIVLCAVFIIVLLLSMHHRVLPSINAVSRNTWGSVLFPVVVIIIFSFYTYLENKRTTFRPTIYFCLPILIMAIADPAAAAFGRRYKYKGQPVAGKTLVGSTAFFVTAFLLSAVLMYGLAETYWNGGMWYVLLIAFTTTVAERISSKGWDNFTIPLTAAGLLYLIA